MFLYRQYNRCTLCKCHFHRGYIILKIMSLNVIRKDCVFKKDKKNKINHFLVTKIAFIASRF